VGWTLTATLLGNQMSYRPICCNFCGLAKEEVDYLIISEDQSAAICDDCVGVCVEHLEEAEEDIPALLH
jgi:uncharacterized metal-binding protein